MRGQIAIQLDCPRREELRQIHLIARIISEIADVQEQATLTAAVFRVRIVVPASAYQVRRRIIMIGDVRRRGHLAVIRLLVLIPSTGREF